MKRSPLVSDTSQKRGPAPAQTVTTNHACQLTWHTWHGCCSIFEHPPCQRHTVRERVFSTWETTLRAKPREFAGLLLNARARFWHDDKKRRVLRKSRFQLRVYATTGAGLLAEGGATKDNQTRSMPTEAI